MLYTEPLEDRRLFAVSLKVDFQPSGAETGDGMIADTGAKYSQQNGYTYGWNADNSTHAVERDSSAAPDVSYDTFQMMQGRFGSRTWQIALPNGEYRVRVTAGDALYNTTPVIMAEGHDVVSGQTTASDRWITASRVVTITDGKLTLKSGDTTGHNDIAFLQIRTVRPGESNSAPVSSTPPTSTPVTSTPPNSADGASTVAANWPTTSEWKTAASAPIATFEAHSFSYQGKLYVFGGWKDSSFHSTKAVQVYDPKTNKWTRLHDMQAPETHAGAAMDAANGMIYFVAGHRGTYPSTPTKELWKYTIKTDTWQKLSATLPYNMGANSVQIVGRTLYSFGGNYSDRVTNDPDMFSLDLDDVSAGFKHIGSMPQARDHLASVVIDGYIYALGGEFGHDKGHHQQKILQRYDPKTNTWTTLASAPLAKSHAEGSTFVLNGKIIFAGGQYDKSTSSVQQPSSSVYQYDPKTNKWSTLASLPAARQGTQVAVVGDYWVFTTGGIQTDQPQSKTWTVKI